MKSFLKCVMCLMMCLASSLAAMTTSGTQILDGQGNPVELKGINWFGFNNQDTMVSGLWSGPSALSVDFENVVYRMQLLGFNAVRLPFSFQDLYNLSPRNYTTSCQTVSLQDIQNSVTNPSVPVPAGSSIPPMIYSLSETNGHCNQYLPNDTTLNRFLWVVNFFARNGFYVLLDNHLREDQTAIQDPQAWVQDWVRLINAISQDPISAGMVMVDLLNEPDNYGIRWGANGSIPSLKDLYLSAMDALYPINSNLLFFLEGTGQGGLGSNWGDGYATDPILIQQYGLSDPNPFFQALLQKPYVNQVVISPHVYPPTVTQASSNYAGTGLWNRLSNSFGYLTTTGYKSGTTTKVFPVALGEFGSNFTDSRDLQSMPDIAAYLNNSGAAADGKHTKIPHFFYWAWNNNSGDTGGIVDATWVNILWNKVDYLTTLGLKPWYLNASPAVYGTCCVTVASVDGLPVSELLPISVGENTFQISGFDQPVCVDLPVGNYTITPPSITYNNYQFKAAPQTVAISEGNTTSVSIAYTGTYVPPPTSSVTVRVQLGTVWQSDSNSNVYYNVVNLYFKNTGNEAITAPWTLTMSNSDYTGVVSAWSMDPPTYQSGTISAVVPTASWQTLKPAPNTNEVNVGLIISSTSENFLPSSITVNGQACQITQ